MSKRGQRLLLVIAALGLSAGAAYFARTYVMGLLNQEALFRYAARNLTEAQKNDFYQRLAAAIPASVWEAVPEPFVGRLLQFNTRKIDLQAELVSNSAGMRSSRPYGPKKPGTFRIVCVGDSMVMGTAGREEDRWGDQIEQILHDLSVRIEGKDVEVYSVGIGSWSAINSATYLTHRLSAYAPDLVLYMAVDNDLNDVGGVLGIGQVSYHFTSEHRDLGSAVFVDHWPQEFGLPDRNLLAAGLGSESQSRWTTTLAALKRLETILGENGGRMVFGVLKAPPTFQEPLKQYYADAGLQSPFIVTEYFGQRLPHDVHPNREGHRILAAHYLHVLAKLGWIPVEEARLPPLHDGLSTETSYPPDPSAIAAMQNELAQSTLSEQIAFDQLRRNDVRAILGGIYPGSEDQPLRAPPYATVKSVFLLRRAASAKRVRVEIDVPDFVELYPFELKMLVNGVPGGTLTLRSRRDAGRHAIIGDVPAENPWPALEVTLRTESYWTTITDLTMRSFRLISARQQ
jgi:lysophospholipase L1-like esterase